MLLLRAAITAIQRAHIEPRRPVRLVLIGEHALGQKADAVRDLDGAKQIVRDHEDRDAAAAQALQQGVEFAASLRVQSTGGFVQ